MRIISGNVRQIQRLLFLNLSKNPYENSVAHYTHPQVLFSLLEEASLFRLNPIDNMNDLSENAILGEWLGLENHIDSSIKLFVASYTLNPLSLNQYRCYGVENNQHGSGVNIEFGANFFASCSNKSSISDVVVDRHLAASIQTQGVFALPLYRCLYLHPETHYMTLAKRRKHTFYENQPPFPHEEIDKQYKRYTADLNEKQKIITIRTELYKMQIAVQAIKKEFGNDLNDLVSLALMPISYLIKHACYEDENECRIGYITSIFDPHIQRHVNRNTFYIPYAPIHDYIQKINLGPRMDKKHQIRLEHYLQKEKRAIVIRRANMPLK